MPRGVLTQAFGRICHVTAINNCYLKRTKRDGVQKKA